MPAANLLSDVVDLSQFLKMNFAEGMAGKTRILLKSSIDEMLHIQNARKFPLTFNAYVGLG